MSEEVIIKSKDVLYRGILLSELKKMEVRETAKYLPSRSKRSVLRGFDKIERFIKRCEASIKNGKKIKTHLRDMVIVPQFVGMAIAVYSGKEYKEVKITPLMIGHRLGEFVLTREKVVHGDPGIGATKSSSADKK